MLAPAGEDAGRREAVWVSLTCPPDWDARDGSGHGEWFELDGRRAVFWPQQRLAGGDLVMPSLIVEAGDLAFEVRRQEATRDELVEIARHVEPGEDRLRAPRVPDPPDGLVVLGGADADVAPSLGASPVPSSDELPGSRRAHVAVWARAAPGEAWTPDAGAVTVVTLPGQAVDLDALPLALLPRQLVADLGRTEERRVAGRPGALVADDPS